LIDSTERIKAFMCIEFSLERIDVIYPKLWRVGLPRPAQPLRTQIEKGRTIVVTQWLDMHLVWGHGKLFLKPVPRYVLEPGFWADLTSFADVRSSALGLLYTYACLIIDPVDLELALKHGLLPSDGQKVPEWSTWRQLALELHETAIFQQIHRRFWRGELRLDRLNWIYVLKDIPAFQMYYNTWSSYTDFVLRNLAWLSAGTVYIVTVLTAMQVGLATDTLNHNDVFQMTSSAFAIFSIMGPLVTTLVLAVIMLIALVPNWLYARKASRGSRGN
ncbi:hypothetical protein CC79DRAFT_1278238, partial [Sarocladium strictum]